jgi:hypothetical protein
LVVQLLTQPEHDKKRHKKSSSKHKHKDKDKSKKKKHKKKSSSKSSSRAADTSSSDSEADTKAAVPRPVVVGKLHAQGKVTGYSLADWCTQKSCVYELIIRICKLRRCIG